MTWYKLNKPTLFVDNQARKRSGHMGHAMVEYAPGRILDFYSNCDYDRVSGHSGYGWMEYRRSTDGGTTWEPARKLDYSVKLYEQGVQDINRASASTLASLARPLACAIEDLME